MSRPAGLRCQREAVEQARLVAETQALRKAPLSWLRFGPGRQTGRLPGWTDAVIPASVIHGLPRKRSPATRLEVDPQGSLER